MASESGRDSEGADSNGTVVRVPEILVIVLETNSMDPVFACTRRQFCLFT